MRKIRHVLHITAACRGFAIRANLAERDAPVAAGDQVG